MQFIKNLIIFDIKALNFKELKHENKVVYTFDIFRVVSIDLFSFSFMPFSYNGVYFQCQEKNLILTSPNAQSGNICPKMLFCVKRTSKIIIPPKEMLLSFSIGTFLTNYYVTNRKL